MSIGGRNHHRGSRVNVYRAIAGEGPGGLTRRVWVKRHESVGMALHTTTDEVARQIFGQEEAIDTTVVVPVAMELQKGDAVVVIAGEYVGRRFAIVAARSLRRYTECGLVSTPELIDETLDGPDPERDPLPLEVA